MNIRILAGILLIALLCTGLLVQTGFPQQQPVEDEEEMVVLRLNDASLLDVMKMLEGVMEGRTFLYTDKVEQQLKQNKIDLVYGPPIPKKYVFNIFETILRSQNFVLKPGGPEGAEVIEIMQSQKTANQIFPVIGPDEELPTTDKFVMQIVQLQYADVNMVRQQLQTLVGRPPSGIIVIPDANIMIISDFATKLKVITKIIGLMDRPRIEPEMHTIPIAYRPATEILDIVNRLLQATTQAGTTTVAAPRRAPTVRRVGGARTPTRTTTARRGAQQSNIALEADETSNTLFVIAPKGEPQVEKVYELIDYLDVLPPEPEPDYHIYRCRYTVAEDLVAALEGVMEQTAETTTGTRTQARGAPPQTTAVATRQPISEELSFLPYEPTNSVIVSGPLEKYRQIQPLLEELDVRTAQVLIEGYIVNISSDDSFILDMDVAELDSSLKPLGSPSTEAAGATGLSVGSPGDTAFQFLSSTGQLLLTGITRQKLRFPFILKALQTKADVSIVSSPIIVATDNEEASFSSTSQRPFGRFTDLASGGIGGARESGFGGYEEAGISLGITPTIGEDGLKLKIFANVSTFRGDPPDPSFPPPREDTNLETLVTVPDGHTLIIGGIKASSETKSYGRVPVLGSIPVVKWLFQGRKKNKTRTNLYIFITPHILRDEEFDDYKKESIERENEFQRGLIEQEKEDISFKKREEELNRTLKKYLPDEQGEESGE